MTSHDLAPCARYRGVNFLISRQASVEVMKSLAVILTLLTFCLVTVAVRDLRYYEAKVAITNGTTSEVTESRSTPAGAYATIAIPCDLTGCAVKSSRHDCSELDKELTTSCYPIQCNNGAPPCDEFVSGSAVPITRNTPRPDGVIVPAKDIKLEIKRLSTHTATTDCIPFPVIVVQPKVAILLSSAGVMFNVLVGDVQFMSSYSAPTTMEHDTQNREQSENVYERPLYYATLFVVIPMFVLIMLVFLATVGLCVIWMCRECTIKVTMMSL